MWKLMFLAGAGGFVGTCCRFLINRLFLLFWVSPFPLATFIINVLGCFIFGLISGLISRNGIISPNIGSLFLVGFCGGFTTFSTFSNESLSLGINGEFFYSISYMILSVIVGLLAVWGGLLITR